jgi:hypothetical protein
MLRLRRKSIALFIIVCTLFLNGLVYAQTVEHESHHAHHQAATHSSVLCSWICAAGVAVGTDPLGVSWTSFEQDLVVVQLDNLYHSELSGSLHPRAPPFLPLF